MRDDHRQANLFDEPAPAPTEPLYTIAELDALYEQLRQVDRIPYEWRVWWHDMANRGRVTLRAKGSEERAYLRDTFLAEVRRLETIEYAICGAEADAKAAAAAKAAEEAKPARRRRKASA